MSIVSVLVHLADDPAEAQRVRAALALAKRLGATVEGVFITPSLKDLPLGYVGRAAAGGYLGALADAYADRAAASEKRYKELTAGTSATWRKESGDAGECLSKRLYYADLAIVGRTPAQNLEEAVSAHPPDHLALIAVAPVILVPPEFTATDIGRTVMIAWKPTREASRAVRLAMPILRKAERVAILTIDNAEDPPGANDELAAWLKLHGVTKVEQRHDRDEDRVAGERILDNAATVGADLVVMGAFGHSRLSELVFGGATRYVLDRAIVPVLMAH
jgi:nucleotide-binding universal stress UspA family protein